MAAAGVKSLLRIFVVALVTAGCAAVEPAGVYSGYGALAGEESQQVRIYLKPDGAASVQAAYSDRPKRYFSEGKWQRLSDGRVIVDLTTERKERLVFLLRGDQLTAVDWNRGVWGERGPGVLYRVP